MEYSDLLSLGEQCLANSKRWFPDPHERGLEHAVLHMTLGIAGEAGEVVEVIKKAHRFGDFPDPRKVAPELVDVLVYVLNLATLLSIDLDIALVQKLEECEARYQRRLAGLPEKP